MTINIRQATGLADMEAARRLFIAYAKSLPIDLSYQGFEAELAALPGKYAPPRGLILIASDTSGVDLGCVALRPLSNDVCEMKRLYVVPEGRRTGTGRQLAQAAISFARAIGYSEIRLDTLETMKAAQGLYASVGFGMIQSYYDTPIEGTVFMSLAL